MAMAVQFQLHVTVALAIQAQLNKKHIFQNSVPAHSSLLSPFSTYSSYVFWFMQQWRECGSRWENAVENKKGGDMEKL